MIVGLTPLRSRDSPARVIHSPPAAAPKIRQPATPAGPGRLGKLVANSAAPRPPMSSAPSFPITIIPRWDGITVHIAVSISGIDRMRLSWMEKALPKEPIHISRYTARGRSPITRRKTPKIPKVMRKRAVRRENPPIAFRGSSIAPNLKSEPEI